MKYDRLFQPGRIGSLPVKNRIVLPAMGTGFAGMNGEANEKIIHYYEERARGGCGLLISEICRIDEEYGIGVPNQLSMTDIKQVYPMENLVEAVHRHGAKFFLQLHHPGRQTKSKLMNGRQPIAPSAVMCNVVKEMPREMTTEECSEMAKKFIKGAVLARMAGVDGVELHAAHGYLLGQFLSPYTNRRTDRYGGSFLNRMRLIAEIIKGIKFMCPGFPISVRISADDYIEGSNKLEDGVKIARYLEGLGIDAINISCGTYESGVTIIEPYNYPEAWKKHLALAVKQHVKIPVIAVNNIKHPQVAEQLLEENVCDFIGLARAQLADADFANKARFGEDKDICNCIGCLYCFREESLAHRLKCAVNPRLGREDVYPALNAVGDGRTVAVIGGGPGGMQAAMTLSDRGFRVTLFEKSKELGGALNLAAVANHKELVAEYRDYLVRQIGKRPIDVRLESEASPEGLSSLDPYAVFVAVGGQPVRLDVPGIERVETLVWDEVLRDGIRPSGKNIVVVGGGVTGLETAEILSEKSHGNCVTVVEMKPEVADLVYPSVRLHLLKTLASNQVTIRTERRLVGAAPGKAVVVDVKTGKPENLDCDLIVFASGVKPNIDVYESYLKAFPRVYGIGDAMATGSILEATRDGYEQAMILR